MPESVCVYETLTRRLKNLAGCVSCIWRVRNHRQNCWFFTRLWQSSSVWSSKWEVSSPSLCCSTQHGAVWDSAAHRLPKAFGFCSCVTSFLGETRNCFLTKGAGGGRERWVCAPTLFFPVPHSVLLPRALGELVKPLTHLAFTVQTSARSVVQMMEQNKRSHWGWTAHNWDIKCSELTAFPQVSALSAL